jgi:hypothetical protein
MPSKHVVVERAEPSVFKRVADEVTAIGRGMQEVEEAVVHEQQHAKVPQRVGMSLSDECTRALVV